MTSSLHTTIASSIDVDQNYGILGLGLLLILTKPVEQSRQSDQWRGNETSGDG